MNFLLNDQIPRSSWIDFFNSNPYASPFQSPGFYDLFNLYKKNSALVFAAEEGNSLFALMVVTLQKEKGITAWFSRRAIIYGGPLTEASEKGLEAIAVLLRGMKKFLTGKAIYCEIRNSFDYSGFKSIFAAEKWKYNPHLNVRINILDKTPEDVLSQMKYARRREIRLTREAGAVVKQADNVEEVKALYEILHNLYDSKVKLPLPGFDYFRTLFLHPPGITFVVQYQDQITGGAFCLYSPGGTLYTFYYAGLRDPKIFPATLAIYGAVEFAINQGLKAVDLMGAGKPDLEYGVRKYKMEFGGELVNEGRFILIVNPSLYKIGNLGLRLRSNLK